MSFFAEIRRRKVFQVAAVYAVVAWLVVQVVSTIEQPLGLPSWFDTAVIVLLVAGFPIAVILSWALEITPQGIKRDSTTETVPIAHVPGQRLSFIVQGLVLIAVGFLVLDQYFIEPQRSSNAPSILSPATHTGISRFAYELPDGRLFYNGGRNLFAISPDGRHFVYSSTRGLYLRSLDELEARLIPRTEGAAAPVFSPDSESIAFLRETGELIRVPVDSGPPLVISHEVAFGFGTNWASDGTILIGLNAGIFRVSENGGALERLIPNRPDQWYYGPRLLPDGEHVIFTVSDPAAWETGRIVVESLVTGERTVVIPRGTDARYLPTGHLVYVAGDTLFAVEFDPDTLTVSGGAIPMLQGIRRSDNGNTGVTQYDVSANGTLIYTTGGSLQARTLAWVDRDGTEEPIPIEPSTYLYPRISPDGSRVVIDDRNVDGDLWVWDFENETRTRLRLGDGGGGYPAWSPANDWIAYDPGTGSIDWRPANNTGNPERLATGVSRAGSANPTPYFFTHDGRYLVFRERQNPSSGHNIGMIEVGGSSEPIWLLDGPANEMNAELSADGRWMAYETNDTGRAEIEVRPFPNVDENVIPISNAGGRMPLWSRDGLELFYLEPPESDTVSRLVSVAFETTETDFVITARTTAIEEWVYRGTSAGGGRPYDQSLDGSRFLVIKENYNQEAGDRIIVVQNWFDELNRFAPRPQ